MNMAFALSEYLVDAVQNAVPGVTVYRDDVPTTPSYPYVFLQTSFPTVTGRSAARSVQYRELTARTTVVGLSVRSVEIIAGKVADRLEGARLNILGWNLGAMESRPNDQRIQPDRDVTIPNIGHPQYAVLDWVTVGSRQAA
jgi:hypothetical protein